MLQFQVPVLQTVQQEQRSVIGQQDYVSGIISGQVMEKLKIKIIKIKVSSHAGGLRDCSVVCWSSVCPGVLDGSP